MACTSPSVRPDSRSASPAGGGPSQSGRPAAGTGSSGWSLGAALLVIALLGAGTEDWESFVRALICLGLLAIAVLTARAALAASLRTTAATQVHRVTRPSHPVLLCNPWSGGGKVEKFGLVELATSLGVETVMLDHGLDLAELARDAIARGADCLGMAGGDGSQALVASIAVEHDLPFVCVAAGTRNHFALDLGLDRARPPPECVRLPRCHRAPGRLRNGERPVLRQQRLARRLRHHRPARGLPGGQGGHDAAAAPRAAGRRHGALRSAVRDARRHRGRRVLPGHGVEQPLRPRGVAQHVPAPPARHGATRCLRRDRGDGRTGGRGRHPRPGRPGSAERPCLRVQLREFEIRSRSGTAYAGIDGEASSSRRR